MPDGAHVQFGVEGAEEPFDVFESLVAQHHIVAFEGVFGQAGAQHVDAVEGGFGGDRVVVGGEGEGVVGDLDGEVFGHLVVVDDLADPQRDRVLAPQWPGSSAGGGRDGGEFFFGGGQQLAAFAGALFGQHGVVAAHQPLAGKLRGADFEQVLLIEQRQLQRALLDQGLDLGGAQRADPVQLRGAHLVADAGVGEHAPIPDQTHPAQPEPVLELVDLGGQGFRVGGVALEHLDGDRDPGGGAQQPVDDLQPAFHPVSGVSDRPQRAGAALERRRGHVIEHQRAVDQMPRGKATFDGVLAGQRPVHGRIQIVLITTGHPQRLAQRAGGGFGAQPARERQLGAGADHLRDQHRGHQIAPT